MIRRIRKIIILFVLGLVIYFSYWVYNQNLISFSSKKKTKYPPKILSVALETESPFSSAYITIYENGQLIYKAVPEEIGINLDLVNEEKRISSEQFQSLISLIMQSNFFDHQPRYTDNSLMDGLYNTVTVDYMPYGMPLEITEPNSKSVSCYGDCPREIETIIEAIKNLWGEEILIIGV